MVVAKHSRSSAVFQMVGADQFAQTMLSQPSDLPYVMHGTGFLPPCGNVSKSRRRTRKMPLVEVIHSQP